MIKLSTLMKLTPGLEPEFSMTISKYSNYYTMQHPIDDEILKSTDV